MFTFKKLFILIVLLQTVLFYAQDNTKVNYLKENRFDLNSKDFKFPQKDFKIIGYGAYHGSQKTEAVEMILLTSLVKDKIVKYYLPETDFSIAHYFDQYLKTGDTILLKDLVTHSGIRVKQERTIEMYEKWKKLKQLNDQLPKNDKLKILGIDYQINYKYASRHILELVNDPKDLFVPIQEIKSMVALDTTSYARGELSYAYKLMKNLVSDFEANKSKYKENITNKEDFEHLIKNLKISFDQNYGREKTMFENYIDLSKRYNFDKNAQFLRMGFSHIEKSKEGKKGNPSFFSMLIDKAIYPKEKVVSVMGYFTESEVVWDEQYDDKGEYTGFTIEGGFGIGDYDKEYFRGIQNLKDTKISDKTLFRLNQPKTPYAIKEADLIEVIMQDEKSNGEAVKGMATIEFIDYAILIYNSKASTPIFEMK